MGLSRRIAIAAKAASKQPLTRTDIYDYADGLIKQPPIPAEWREAFSKTFANLNGVPLTVLDYFCQELLRPDLDKLAAGPTWEMQRVQCIRQILDEMDWRNMYFCLRHAKSEWGRAMTYQRLDNIWRGKSREQQFYLLTVWYMMSVTAQACAQTIGAALYELDKKKEMEIELCFNYGREIMMLDVHLMDVIHERYASAPEIAYRWAAWKDDNLNPITTCMRQVLEAAQNSIAYGTFNIKEFGREMDRLQAEKVRLRRSILTA
jgi:hypothetical protein